MAFIILGSGLFLSIRLGFFQLSHIGEALRTPFAGRRKNAGGVTPFQAMATALGSSVGTANIAGVAGAVALGGPGAVFWMWIAGIVGMGTKLVEIVLAMKYRDRSVSPPAGGPMYYMEKGLGRFGKALAVVFSSAGVLAGLVGTALVQSNTVALAAYDTVCAFGADPAKPAVLLIAGLFTSFLTGAVILGGAKRIGRFSEAAVPFMAAGYAAAAAAVIIANASRLPGVVSSILRGAFGVRQGLCGAAGFSFLRAFRVGAARGVYSNEAGVGSAPMAHAGSDETDPVKQGLMGIFEVFIDTLVMCTLTALALLTSSVPIPYGDASASGTSPVCAAFASVFGVKAAPLFISVSVLLFAFTSLVGWSLYGERCASYLFGKRSVMPFRAAFLLLIPAGAMIGTGTVWKLGECFNYLMALPNIAALLLLSGKAAREISVYKMFEKKRRRGYNKR